LSKGEDTANFPPGEFPDLFARYEKLFDSALRVLRLTKDDLKRRPEFNFDSGDAANLESCIAILRVIEALRLSNFLHIALVNPTGSGPSADLICEKNGQKVCLEVKSITKQSSGRAGLYLQDQLYEKILENIAKARTQLEASARDMHCTVRVFACVVNWFAQSIHLNQGDYQCIVNRLERNGDQESLKGIDGVLFVTKTGQQFWFLNECGKSIE
jgi:hypothetical protein